MVFNKGYIGNGIYKSQINGVKNPIYDIWHSILERCYHNKTHQRFPTYDSCEVSEEWLNFQNFAQWYNDNIYYVPDEKMCVDKDILYKNNKIYSKQTCCIVPNHINMLFTKVNKIRGEYPVGVYFDNRINRYVAKCKSSGKSVYLGSFNTVEQAFEVYKNYKEHEIKHVADLYKKYIPQNVYEALYKYQVEITD